MSKISREVAELEIKAWLDFKRVEERKRLAFVDSIETLIEAVMDGRLVLRKEDHFLIQNLAFPTTGDDPITKLEYKPRLKVFEVHQQTANERPGDAEARILAYVAALTGKVKGIIKQLDTEDYTICQSIAVFFV